MLFIGCCAVSETPAVCVWKRNLCERSLFAPKRSVMVRYQMLRAARNLPISSKKSLCELKKKLSRGAKSSMFKPRRTAHSAYSIPSYRVKPSSCNAGEAASGMWYPEIEIGLNRGVASEPNSNVSTTRRMDGAGGKMYSFCAMYSLRMSFWSVPERFLQSAPFSSATTRYIAQRTLAGELIVIDTDVFSRP